METTRSSVKKINTAAISKQDRCQMFGFPRNRAVQEGLESKSWGVPEQRSIVFGVYIGGPCQISSVWLELKSVILNSRICRSSFVSLQRGGACMTRLAASQLSQSESLAAALELNLRTTRSVSVKPWNVGRRIHSGSRRISTRQNTGFGILHFDWKVGRLAWPRQNGPWGFPSTTRPRYPKVSM